jgi:hypothetical protein
MTLEANTNKIEEYSAIFCPSHADGRYNQECDTCGDNYEILRDFYNDILYDVSLELRAMGNDCNQACAEDIENMLESYD